MKILKQLYQGDVSLMSVDEFDNVTQKSNKPIVVAEGETSGHKHQVLPTCADTVLEYDFDIDTCQFYLRVSGAPAEIVHEEHETITLDVGNWVIGRQYEFDEREEYKKVLD